MQVDPATLAAIRRELETLATLVRGVELSPAVVERVALEVERIGIVRTIDRYLQPRFEAPDAPVFVAIVGPGGTGKSTLVNSIAESAVTATAPTRPTTTIPVVWTGRRPGDAFWAETFGRIGEDDRPRAKIVFDEQPLTSHVTIVDTPPIDYEPGDGTASAREVLSLSDICVFVTSPARYADAVGWRFVREARARGVPTLFVFNRLPSDDDVAQSLLRDLATRLHARDLLLAPDPGYIFGVREDRDLLAHGGLDPAAVVALRNEFEGLRDPAFRIALMTQTALTTTVSVADRTDVLVGAFTTEQRALERLGVTAGEVYEEEADRIGDELRAGDNASVADRAFWPEAWTDLASVATRRAGVAAQRTATFWSESAAGRALLQDDGEGLWRHGEDIGRETAAALDSFFTAGVDLSRRRSRRGRLRAGAANKSFDEVWRLALDPQRSARSLLRRRYGDRLGGMVAEVREGLVSTLTDALRRDGERFRQRVTPVTDAGTPGALASAADRVRTLARSAVPTEDVAHSEPELASPSEEDAVAEDEPRTVVDEVEGDAEQGGGTAVPDA